MSMKNVMTPPLPAVTFRCDMPGFLMDWQRCDQLSNYLAEVLSFTKSDPFAYTNLLSSIINEVLESIFCHNAGYGQLGLQLSETSSTTTLCAEFAADEETQCLFRQTIDRLTQEDPVQLYESMLFQVSDRDVHDLCLYEIAADYGVRLSIADSSQQSHICLMVQMDMDSALKHEDASQ